MTVLRPSRRPAGSRAAVAVLAVCALAGCSQLSPQTTQNVTYAPSDGVQGQVGEVKVRNVLVLTSEQGGPAELVGSLFNPTGEDVSLEVVVREPAGDDGAATEPLATETIELGGAEDVMIGPDADQQVSLEQLDVVPGRFAEVSFTGGGGELVLQVPVLDGTLPEYADLVPGEG